MSSHRPSACVRFLQAFIAICALACVSLAIAPQVASAGGTALFIKKQDFGGTVNGAGATDGQVLTFTAATAIWGAASPSGGSETLAQTLVFGNTTGGTDLEVSSGDVLLLPDGTAGAPALAFAADADGTGTGMRRPGADVIDFVTNGNRRLEIQAAGVFVDVMLTPQAHIRMQDSIELRLGLTDDVRLSGELVALTDGSATTALSIQSSNGDMGGVEIIYTIQSTDGVDAATEQGRVQVSTTDLAGGITESVSEVSTQTFSAGISSLATTWACSTTDDGSLEVTVNADVVGITPTTHQIRLAAFVSGDVTVTIP